MTTQAFIRRLGYVIAQHRQSAGLTQRELAHQAGIHHVSLSKIERGIHKDLGCVTLYALAKALHVEGHALYALAESK